MNIKSGQMNYQQAVEVLRADPEAQELIRASYLDENISEAAARFADSEEFKALQSLLGSMEVPERGDILDLGCGNGIVSLAFANTGYKVYSLDPDLSEKVGLKALQKLASNTKTGKVIPVQGFAEQLPFKSNSFDVVYLRQAAHHFHDLKAGFVECGRVIRPGGVLIATREHVVDNKEQLKEFLENHPMQALHGGEYAYSVKEYLNASTNAGLKIVKILMPFDSPINFHPIRSSEIRSWLINGLSKRIGNKAAEVLANLRFAQKYYQKRLSNACSYPGRLYSFVARKTK